MALKADQHCSMFLLPLSVITLFANGGEMSSSQGRMQAPLLVLEKARSICSTASNTSNSGSGNDLCTILMGWLTTPTWQTRQACTEIAHEPSKTGQGRVLQGVALLSC